MKSLYVLSAIAVLGFYGCQDGGSGSANIAGTDDAVGDSGAGGGGDSSGGASNGPDDEPLDIPSGTFALFVSLSMDSRNGSWPTGGAVSWEETDTGLLDANDHSINGRSLYGIGDQLVSVGFRAPDQYEIRLHNAGTGAVDEVLLTISGAEVFGPSFFAGDGGLYWLRFDERTSGSRSCAIPWGEVRTRS